MRFDYLSCFELKCDEFDHQVNFFQPALKKKKKNCMLEQWEGFFLFPFKASSDQLHFFSARCEGMGKELKLQRGSNCRFVQKYRGV